MEGGGGLTGEPARHVGWAGLLVGMRTVARPPERKDQSISGTYTGSHLVSLLAATWGDEPGSCGSRIVERSPTWQFPYGRIFGDHVWPLFG